MVATGVELEQIIRAFAALLATGIKVEAIILYGSYARGNAYEDSDIDLAVISPDFEGLPINRRQEIIADLTLHADLRVSPTGYPSSEYHTPGRNSFLLEVIRTGKVVYSANSLAS